MKQKCFFIVKVWSVIPDSHRICAPNMIMIGLAVCMYVLPA